MTAQAQLVRPTWADIDLRAIADNAAALAAHAAPARLCAVVKANGYGHGAAPVARAALAAGASHLAVALVEEGVSLRDAGIDAPIILLSEPPPPAFALAIAHELQLTLYSHSAIDAAERAAAAARARARVHLKADTGMHRVGAAPADVLGLARTLADAPNLIHEGTCTHLAVADDVSNPYTAHQLSQFDGVLDALRAEGIEPGIVHAANSAGTIAHPSARYDLVRCGISLYGLRPDIALDPLGFGIRLVPAMALSTAVTHVRRLPAGEAVSYGLIHRLDRPSTVATIPIGYADGVPRRLSAVGGEVLIGGKRRRLLGRVTMDQSLVDCGDEDVSRGDPVVLIGRQGDDEISAWEWAAKLDTIAYEVTCGVSARVPRRYSEEP